MQLPTPQLEALLVPAGLISAEQFRDAVNASQAAGKSVDEVLVDRGIIAEDALCTVLAKAAGVPYLRLGDVKIDDTVLALIPEIVARSKGVVAVRRTPEGIIVGMRDPTDIEARHLVEQRAGERIIPHLVCARDFEAALQQYKAEFRDAFAALLRRLEDEDLTREQRDEITVQLVDLLLQYGHHNKSSDIHVEPHSERLAIRFRVDGVMHDMLDLPKTLMDPIHTRIKVLAKMRTDLHLAAQDGKLRFRAKEGFVDVRVSIVPVTEGENIVMRLLSTKTRQYNLDTLGFSPTDLEKVRLAIDHPHGMILVTGPTGSGKSTTLYGILTVLNSREVHIVTIEDPVEYDIDDITQIQVNPKAGLTFASGLRAIVRQDPDIIMVGEIRDSETADIAVNAALTGHLVLSTLHTNDAATTLPRLLDMSIEPFLVASTVIVTIGQRLVRKVCPDCQAVSAITEAELLTIEHFPYVQELLRTKSGKTDIRMVELTRGKGCIACSHTGYQGRIGIFEVLVVDTAIQELIIKRVTSDALTAAAVANGMTTMLEDGITKVLNGTTTLEEILRATRE